jgi:hypothetical protein
MRAIYSIVTYATYQVKCVVKTIRVTVVKNGQRLIGRSGAVHGFGNILELLPGHNVGYYISFNAECWNTSSCDIIPGFRQAFLDRASR